MGTWVGAIIETAGRADFWDIARRHGVEATTRDVPARVLVNCDIGFDFEASVRLAEAMSKSVGAGAIGFVVQTAADVHELHAFVAGTAVRRLGYSRDEGGWLVVEGAPQPWERAYFFDPEDVEAVCEDLSDEDRARYEAASRAGDGTSVLDLIHPSSMAPMRRACTALGVRPDRPDGRWRKRGGSLLSRLFGRKT